MVCMRMKHGGPFRYPSALVLFAFLFLSSCAGGHYGVYRPDDLSVDRLTQSFIPRPLCRDEAPALPPLPESWEVVGAAFADVTGDNAPEWIIAISRPWRDWPIIRWHGGKSPIETFRDRDGDSSHLVVMARSGTEIWAGSALPRPIRALAAGDINGDGAVEVVTLEGDYADGPGSPARFIDVWAWDVFGFVLLGRSAEGSFDTVDLQDIDGDGILDVIVRYHHGREIP